MYYYLGYVSAASFPYKQNDFESILHKSRANNLKLGITGILIYIEGTIMQILEGNKETVEQLYQIIKDDERHRAVVRVLEGESEKRNFSDWTMGFKTMSLEEFQDNPYFFDIESPANLINNNTDPHPAHIFLKSFCIGDM